MKKDLKSLVILIPIGTLIGLLGLRPLVIFSTLDCLSLSIDLNFKRFSIVFSRSRSFINSLLISGNSSLSSLSNSGLVIFLIFSIKLSNLSFVPTLALFTTFFKVLAPSLLTFLNTLL